MKWLVLTILFPPLILIVDLLDDGNKRNEMKDGRIEIDNNLAENAIRPFALGRKNWLFQGSPKGAKAGATFYSLIETCKANHIEPYRYFCAMLHRIRFCKSQEDYQALLPQFIQMPSK